MGLESTVSDQEIRQYQNKLRNYLLGGCLFGCLLGYVVGGKVHDYWVRQGKESPEYKYKTQVALEGLGGAIGSLAFLIPPMPKRKEE